MPKDGIEFIAYGDPGFIEKPTLAELGRTVHTLITKYGARPRFREQLTLWDKGFSEQLAAEVAWQRKREGHELWGITQSRWLDEKAGPPELGCNFEGFRLIEPPDEDKPGRSGPRLGLWFRPELCSRNCPEAELPLPPRQGEIELHAQYAVFAAIHDYSMKGQQRLGDGLALDHFDMLTGLDSPLPDDDRHDGLILQIPAGDEDYLRIWLDDIEGDLQAQVKNPAEELLAVTGEEHAVLKYLASASPVLRPLADIEQGAKVGRKTAGQCVNNLIKKGLAHRPEGENRGATITRLGRETLSHADSA